MNRPRHYILVGQEATPLPEDDDLLLWAEWFETADRIVKQEFEGAYFVSTVFLGLDHNRAGTGPPLLFETMVWIDGGTAEDYINRCSTWTEALAMHEAAKAWAKEQQRGDK